MKIPRFSAQVMIKMLSLPSCSYHAILSLHSILCHMVLGISLSTSHLSYYAFKRHVMVQNYSTHPICEGREFGKICSGKQRVNIHGCPLLQIWSNYFHLSEVWPVINKIINDLLKDGFCKNMRIILLKWHKRQSGENPRKRITLSIEMHHLNNRWRVFLLIKYQRNYKRSKAHKKHNHLITKKPSGLKRLKNCQYIDITYCLLL